MCACACACVCVCVCVRARRFLTRGHVEILNDQAADMFMFMSFSWTSDGRA